MARTKQTVRRLPVTPAFVSAPGLGNKRLTKQRNKEFKIKKLLPQPITVDLKKNGQVIRKMRVRRKTIHFSGKRTLRF